MSEIEELRAEVERLTRWKSEATEVILGLQDLGRALELPLGERITGEVAAEAARTLKAEVERLREDVAEYDGILSRQGDLLTRTVNALKGDPAPLTTWSHHDVPELAEQMATDVRNLLRDKGTISALVTQNRARAGSAEAALTSEREAHAGLRARLETLADDLAGALAVALYDAHPVYANTTGWRGGVGGQAITQGCSMIDPPPQQEWLEAGLDLLSTPLRAWIQERPGFDLAAAKARVEARARAVLTPIAPVAAEEGGEQEAGEGTHQRPGCTCGGISACLVCQEADEQEVGEAKVTWHRLVEVISSTLGCDIQAWQDRVTGEWDANCETCGANADEDGCLNAQRLATAVDRLLHTAPSGSDEQGDRPATPDANGVHDTKGGDGR